MEGRKTGCDTFNENQIALPLQQVTKKCRRQGALAYKIITVHCVCSDGSSVTYFEFNLKTLKRFNMGT